MQVFTGLGNLGDTTSTLLPKYSSVSIERTLLAKNLNIPSEPHVNFTWPNLGREWPTNHPKHLGRAENKAFLDIWAKNPSFWNKMGIKNREIQIWANFPSRGNT